MTRDSDLIILSEDSIYSVHIFPIKDTTILIPIKCCVYYIGLVTKILVRENFGLLDNLSYWPRSSFVEYLVNH